MCVMVEAKIFYELCGQGISNYYKYRASEACEDIFTIFDCLKHFGPQIKSVKSLNFTNLLVSMQ